MNVQVSYGTKDTRNRKYLDPDRGLALPRVSGRRLPLHDGAAKKAKNTARKAHLPPLRLIRKVFAYISRDETLLETESMKLFHCGIGTNPLHLVVFSGIAESAGSRCIVFCQVPESNAPVSIAESFSGAFHDLFEFQELIPRSALATLASRLPSFGQAGLVGEDPSITVAAVDTHLCCSFGVKGKLAAYLCISSGIPW